MTDETIKTYFLGQLGKTEAERIEETLALDQDLCEHALMIESEIIDDYLRDRLSASDRTLFETNYLATESRREKIRLAQALLAEISARPENTIETGPHTSYFQVLLGGLRFSRVFAAAGVVLLLSCFLALFWLTRSGDDEVARLQDTDLKRLDNINQTTDLMTPQVNIPNENGRAPTPAPSPTTAGPTFASFTLLPGTLRSGGEQFITIPPTAKTVRLQLALPKDSQKYNTYSATITTADGAIISTTSALITPTLTIPAGKIGPGTYVVFLEGISPSKPAESVAEYTFRVRH